MSDVVFQSLAMYLLAIIISGLAAVLIKGIVVALSFTHKDAEKPAGQPAPPVADGIPAEHVAAITAAVLAAMGGFRVVRIRDDMIGYSWKSAGRWLHQNSHRQAPRGRH